MLDLKLANRGNETHSSMELLRKKHIFFLGVDERIAGGHLCPSKRRMSEMEPTQREEEHRDGDKGPVLIQLLEFLIQHCLDCSDTSLLNQFDLAF